MASVESVAQTCAAIWLPKCRNVRNHAYRATCVKHEHSGGADAADLPDQATTTSCACLDCWGLRRVFEQSFQRDLVAATLGGELGERQAPARRDASFTPRAYGRVGQRKSLRDGAGAAEGVNG